MLDQLQARLQAYYASHGAGQPGATVGPLSALTGGWASRLYTFTLRPHGPAGAEAPTLVLKTYAPTARGREHATREWRALRGLHAAGLAVPRASLCELDAGALGAPFVVMEHIAGQPLWEALAQAEPAERDRLTRLFVGRLAELHRLAPQLLEPTFRMARPHAPLERELRQLRRDARRSRHTTLAGVVDWLEQRQAAVPCAQPAILHRDYHPWNVLLDAAGRLWVIDWDWRIGDARFDLAWALMLMRRSHFDAFSDAVLAEYARQSERAIEQLEYFEVLATMRWLLNVAPAVEPWQLRRDPTREEFREFLREPVRNAALFVQAQTGLAVSVNL